jgi:nucleotide-binding universal stress UspA family protein
LVNVPGANGVEREVAEGPAASVLVEAADGADLLVVGSRGRGGFKGLLLGSVSQECVQHARCPVAISGRPGLAGEDVGSTGRILVGLDGSEGARRALDWASGEARLRGARLRLLLAWQFPLGLFSEPGLLVDGETVERLAQIGREMLDEMCQGLGPVLEGLEVERVAVQGPPAAALVAGSADADLLVVGTRGHGGFAGLLLGSVSQACAHHAVCPLVVVPPPRG